MFASLRVCVCVCVCAFGSVNLTVNPTLIYPLILTTAAFQPQSKVELQDAVKACDIDPRIHIHENVIKITSTVSPR